jgi:hypothetical protein
MDNQAAEIVERGLGQLRDLLGPAWEVAVTDTVAEGSGTVVGPGDSGADTIVRIGPRGGGYSAEVLVEAKASVSPAEARTILGPQLVVMERLLGSSAAIIIAPWLSPRSRAILDERGCGYLDFSGNVSLRLNRPGIVIRTEGARQSPASSPPQGRTLGGARAGRLIRVLADVYPPYRPTELATATELSLGYVSRLLDVIADEGLITRRRRSVIDLDWMGLLRARAEATTLLGSSRSHGPRWVGLLAPKGPRSALDRLAGFDSDHFAVTGSVAAAKVAPAAVGGQLMLYVRPAMSLAQAGRELGLLPTEHGADVVLLEAADSVVFAGIRRVDRVAHVALSQLAVDCLSGPGRMPAEGEAVLARMTASESAWRLRNLEMFTLPTH